MAAKLARFSWIPGGLAAALVIAAGRLLFSTPSSGPLELDIYDRVMRAGKSVADQDIVIVTIDEASIARLGEWPWPRDVHASLLNRLRGDGARVVAFTVPFDTSRRTSELERLRAALALLESSNLGNSEQARQLRRLLGESAPASDPNAHLAQAMTAQGNVVLPVDLRIGEQANESLDLPTGVLPTATPGALRSALSGAAAQPLAPIFSKVASAVGHTYTLADDDGVVRSDVLAVRVGSALVPSMALAIAARATDTKPGELTFDANGTIHLAGRDVTTHEGLRVHPHFFARRGGSDKPAFAQFPYWSVLAGEVPSAELRDKIVLIGFAARNGSAASLVTPTGDAMPQVMATASTVSSLLNGNVYARPPLAIAIEWVAAIGVILFAAFALPALGAGVGVIATAVLIAVLVVAEVGLLTSMHMWVRLMATSVACGVGLAFFLGTELVRRSSSRQETESPANLRNLGQTFQRQGQLDLAFETYRRCPLDGATMELLYQLGMDFERRAQLQKAAMVYGYISTRDPNYRDLRIRRVRVQDEPLTRAPATRAPVTRPPATQVAPADPWREEYEAAPVPRSSPTLGRYEIERELGKGAMGTVYLGRDPKINRVVAIKAIPLAEEFEEEDLAEARARFFREAEMAGRLNHPAIVTVYDAGEDQGLAYIAMEYLRGQHLSHYTDPARLLPPGRVMLLVARVAEALHYAHRQNVVHRDIKPANIMFDPDTDELKITDFGIARLTDTSRTKTGIVLGTPSFMSPEQLEGRPLDGRSDQFALGISLYHLLSGQLPFRAESMPRLMHKIATEPHAPVRTLRPELPARIDAIIDRVLAKSTDDRYANCAELAAALRECAGPAAAPRAAQPEHEWLIP